ncbi:hypothetical protein ACIBI0_38745 [Microbispora rosea]|uniref:hypothetical protein n=1 Tax=Microbispora rosea TaxID=58117 RepID=UPI0037A3449B
MASTTRKLPAPAGTFQITPNGRLTEHTAHLDLSGDVLPEVAYPSGGRIVKFTATKVIVRYQWSWSNGGGWRVLEVKATGISGTHPVTAKFVPEKAPEWVQEVVKSSTPPLVLAPAVAQAG